jgi:DNA-binding transcriptional ArsR family regulator
VARRSQGGQKATVGRPFQGRESPDSSPKRSQAPVKPAAHTPLRLDRLIHERLRLGIVSALAVNERLTFYDLKQLLQTTDGNLSVHAKKLEEAEYITCHKSLDGGVSRTEFRIAAAGRRALDKYVAHMEAILGAVKS